MSGGSTVATLHMFTDDLRSTASIVVGVTNTCLHVEELAKTGSPDNEDELCV